MMTYWDAFMEDYYNRYEKIRALSLVKLLEVFWNYCFNRDEFDKMFRDIVADTKE
jgi:hypothetical protein